MTRAPATPAGPGRPRASRARQRQRLIDACISALHVHGPSNTTVEKVVTIARMSPGIVRFYFDSKAAMLVASLEYLAAEFEEQLLGPVGALRATPVPALERLVEIYLGAEIASARKVSVWYSFWGEASSRQEYYDICGQRDARFELLVRELIQRLIEDTGSVQLDADAIALGLIGVLEMLWQGYAFQTESTIDRAQARRRCMAYLRSVFPAQFPAAGGAPDADDLPPGAYANARLHEAERTALFAGSWQFVGLERELAARGDYLTLDVPGARALVVRGPAGLRAFQNACPHRPHALLAARCGRVDEITCTHHALAYDLAGRATHGAAPALSPLELAAVGGLLFVRAATGRPGAQPPAPAVAFHAATLALVAAAPPAVLEVDADWKLVVEQWLDRPGAVAATAAGAEFEGEAQARVAAGWSAARYLALGSPEEPAQPLQSIVLPNQHFELRSGCLQVVLVLPLAPGRCRLYLFDYRVGHEERALRARTYLAARLARLRLAADLALAASIQQGLDSVGAGPSPADRLPAPLAEFRHIIAGLIPGARRHPGDPP